MLLMRYLSQFAKNSSLTISNMSGMFVATFSVVVQVNVMLGFEISLKICLLGSSILLEYLSEMKTTSVASLSVRVTNGILGVNLIEMHAQQ